MSDVRQQKQMSPEHPPGFDAARRVVELGRAAFFAHAEEDIPIADSPIIQADDRLPQFGYVGSGYSRSGILLLGINPGNGPRAARNAGDEAVMPYLSSFVEHPTPENFLLAQQAYQRSCQGWLLWGRECNELLAAAGVSMNDIAFSNALPWRTKSESGFKVAIERRAAENYLAPLLDDLKPKVLVAVGKKVSRMLGNIGRIDASVVVWNRERALRPSVIQEREQAAMQFARLIFQP